MRLNKYIAQSGVASRRKADELTLAGKVKINGVVMDQPGYDVQEGDVVTVNGQNIRPEKKMVYTERMRLWTTSTVCAKWRRRLRIR